MRRRKYAQIALSIDRFLFSSEPHSEFIHCSVSFVEVRHGLDKRNFCSPKCPKHGIVQGLYVDLSKQRVFSGLGYVAFLSRDRLLVPRLA